MSSHHRDDEVVDQFGRTVVAGSPRNNGRTVVTASGPRDNRNRSYSNSGEFHHQGRSHDQDRRSNYRTVEYNVKYQDRRDDYGGNRIVQPYNPDRIAPILTFKSFMQNQSEDHPPEVFQLMYDQYHLNYLQEFSDRFFRESMMEEWFQDRYNPVRIHALEEAAADRAISESAAMRDSLLTHPAASVKAMCLDPPPAPVPKGKRSDNNTTSVSTSAAEADNMEVSDSDIPIATKHLSGHEDRTLYISGIHASCTRTALQTSILLALVGDGEEADEIPAPERVLLAQPVWTNFDGHDKFERFAWIVMPTASAAKQALRKLSDLRVEVPYPVEPSDPEPQVEFSFTVHARAHTPKIYFEKADSCAHHQRVEADTVRALEIAALLDEDRSVSAETRLAAILEERAVQEALVKPTDCLDVAIAYLRRVHLVVFYGARRFRDESQLLAFAPSVPHRVKEYVPPAPPSASAIEGVMDEQVVESESTEAAAEPNSPTAPAASRGKRKHMDEDEDVQEMAEGEDSMETGAGDAMGELKPPPPPGRPNQRVLLTNPRIESILVELREKVNQTRNRTENPEISGSADEEDAKTLSALQEKTFELAVEKNLKQEKEGKCRCCFVSCNKLFKGTEFLAKHMRAKHEDFAHEALLQDAEPFMRRRFEAEPMSARPLPPVEVETQQGRTELKSVKVILDKYMHATSGSHRDARRQSGGEAGGNEGRRRGHDDRDRRMSGGASSRQQQTAHYVEPRSEDNFSRKISSYIDVDAPKESAVSIEYGVALPPIKKRRTSAGAPKKPPADDATAI